MTKRSVRTPARRRVAGKTRSSKRWAGALGVGLLGLLGLTLASRLLTADVKPGPEAADPVQVVDSTTLQLNPEAAANLDVAPVTEAAFPEVLSIMGTISVVENRVASVPARVAGRIDSVYRVSGEFVHTGDALASEYSPDYVAAREEYLQVLKRGGVPSGDSASAQAGASDFTNLAAMTRKKLLNMGLSDEDIINLPDSPSDGHLTIHATRDGAITAVNTVVGNMQNQGDVLMTISDLDKVWFSGDLYSGDLAKVHHGQRIQIQTEGLSQPVLGQLSFISPVIDSSAHTIKVRALIDNPRRVLRGGMTVQADLVLSEKKAVVIPQTAVLNFHNSYFAFKALGQDRFQEVPVKLGLERAGLATVLSGLLPGDQVVSSGGIVLDQAFQGGDSGD
jgi:multidrug efflux pump subunit AcrA (membrane-fusion protein)